MKPKLDASLNIGIGNNNEKKDSRLIRIRRKKWETNLKTLVVNSDNKIKFNGDLRLTLRVDNAKKHNKIAFDIQ